MINEVKITNEDSKEMYNNEDHFGLIDERSREEIEQLVIYTRLHLYNYGPHYGAKAIREQLDEENIRPLPSISTINRILSKNYLTNGRTGYYPGDYR